VPNNPPSTFSDPEIEPNHGPGRSKPQPGLYLVATPIGNARDITLRALDVLRAADIVACEDTRVSAKLFTLYGIHAATLAYHDHNAAQMRPRQLRALQEGKIVALISDAGTPLIADPGWRLAREAVEAGHYVTALPGASAPVMALTLSGLPSDRFLFAGFLPERSAERRRSLRELQAVPASLVFFESPRRLADSLADALAVLGDRPAAVARELTKLFEEIRRGSLQELAAHYAEAPTPKGEIVLLIGPPDADAVPPDATAAIDAALTKAMANASLKQAVADVAAELGLPRREVYARALRLSGKTGGQE
jgi:16S rRNA (cytidine1402-2'-O)-methyltransferase